MKLQTAIIFFLAVVLLGSCKAFKNLTTRDNSVSSTKTKQNKNRNIRFINGIAVTPGGMVNNKKNIPANNSSETKNEKIIYAPPPFSLTSINIETVDTIQLKYAVVLDATVEQLLNITLLKDIDHWWGTRYCYGGTTENCIDCSAFTQIIMHDVYGIDVPRTAQEQYDNSEHIGMEDLQEGDLVFFNTEGSVSHVGVYLTNNKFVHASSSSGVMVSDLNDTYWKPRFIGAGRARK